MCGTGRERERARAQIRGHVTTCRGPQTARCKSRTLPCPMPAASCPPPTRSHQPRARGGSRARHPVIPPLRAAGSLGGERKCVCLRARVRMPIECGVNWNMHKKETNKGASIGLCPPCLRTSDLSSAASHAASVSPRSSGLLLASGVIACSAALLPARDAC